MGGICIINEKASKEVSKELSDKLSSVLKKLDDNVFRKEFKDDPIRAAKKADIDVKDMEYLPVGASFSLNTERFVWCECSGCGCCCTSSAGKGVGCGEYGGSWA